MSKKQKKSALGNAPLEHGIFQKTSFEDESPTSLSPNKESQKPEPINFLASDDEFEITSVQLNIALNDWLNELVVQSKRRHGRKIKKATFIQGALQLLKSCPIDWAEVSSEDRLREELYLIHSLIHEEK